MRISQKLILTFAGIVLLMGVVGYISITTIRKALKESIGEQSVALAGDIADKVDISIYRRIEQLQAYSRDIAQEPALINANNNFDEMNDVLEYISRKDSEWTGVSKEQITPFMRELIDNELSQEIRDEFELKEFYEHKYNYPIFAEVFVTNKYGVNIAQTRKTSDYYQADERWWQKAKDNGLYVSDIEYDESSDIYSIQLGVRIDDEEGKFLGVVKAVLNVAEVVSIVKEIYSDSQYKTMNIELLTAQGEMVYRAGEHEFVKRLPTEELGFCEAASGYFVFNKQGEEEELIAYVHSRGYRDFAGLGWLVMVKYETQEIFAPVNRLRNYILSILSAVAIFSILIGLVMSGSISKRLKRLSDSIAEVGEGDMDVSIEVASKDEIADLAESFNTMVSNLKEVTASRKSLNEEIVIRRNTEEKIKTINRQLRRNEEYLRKLNCLQTELLKPGTIAEKSKIVTDAVVRIFDADFCRIWLAAKGDRCDTGCIHADVTEEPHVCKYRDKCLYLTSSSGRYTHIDGEVHQRVPFGCYKIGRVAADHESKFLTNDVIHDPRVHDHDWAAQCGLVSFAGYQLRPPGGQTIGVLALFSKHPISPDEDAFLENLANTTAQVMQTARTEEELEQTVHALEEVNTELKDFVYIASHDLREPLRKISSFGELLRDSLADKLEPDDVENFEFMIDGADRMTKMIEGLLVYSRLNKDNEAFEAVDLNEIVEQLKQLELNILLAETGAVIEVSENMPKVLGDETQIKQVLQNFISNGIKYRAKDVQPRITITAQQINEREVKVQVRDNGIGIEEKYYSDVFKMFRRLHSRQEYKGTGIGLAVCKKIIDKHKGRIGVESEPGKGTTFFFILSVAKETVPSQEMATVA